MIKSKKNKYKKHQLYVMRKVQKKVRMKKTYSYHIRSRQLYAPPKCYKLPSFKIQQLLEYHVFFGEEAKDINIEKIISMIPRETLLRFVGVLCNIYGYATLDKLRIFFSPRSINNRRFVQQRVKQLKRDNPHKEYIFCSDLTCMEIMRYAFAYSPVNLQFNKNEEEGEMLFFKLLLIINEKIFSYKALDNYSTSKMVFLLSCINPTVITDNSQSIKDRTIYQLEQAVKFFNMITKEDKYLELYKLFLSHHRINCWEEYIITIYALLTAGFYKPGVIGNDLHIDVDHLLNKEVLTSLSIPFDKVINISSLDNNDRCTNTDYRVFRDRPIITLRNGDFNIFNIEFLVDRLYNSLYFDFKIYNDSCKSKTDITRLFTYEFSERIMFDFYMKKSIDNNRYKEINVEECNISYNHKKDEDLGSPDYIVKKNNAILLFECKDIRINGSVIETHDYERIIEEYRGKIYKKPITKEQFKRIGITQLTGHIESIRKNKFKRFNANKDIIIYPVLVLSDYKYLKSGLNVIANEWYNSSLKELDIIHENNKPLIIMSFLTLFKYHNLFKKNGLDYYYDLYFKTIGKRNDKKWPLLRNITFDLFMSQFQYNLDNIESSMLTILHKKNERNVPIDK